MLPMPLSIGNAVTAVFVRLRTRRRARASSPPSRQSILRILAALLIPGVLPLSASAAEILIEPSVGFHGVFQLGRPFPLQVTLDNIGQPADGILEVQVWKRGATQGSLPYPSLHRREVFLPARSRRTVQFTVDPDLLSRPLTIRFTSPAATASRELDLRAYFSPAPVVLSVSGGSALSLTSLGASFTNRIVALDLAELPPEARAMLGVSHLVLYEQSLRDLSRTQLQALEDWLASGGRMVIIGSLNFTLYQEPQLARFLPVKVTGVKRTTFAPHGGTAPIAGVWAQTGTVVRGRGVSGSQDLPVLVEDDWGRGKVVYLALDAGRPPLSAWSGLPKLLESLLAPATGDKSSIRPQWNETIFSQLLLGPSFVSSYIPTRALFFSILGYLAGIVVLGRLWQRRRMGLRALAALCCGWIVCAAAAGYFFFTRDSLTQDGVLLEASVLESAGDGYVDAQTNVALFSTQRREYSLGFGRGWLDLMPLPAPSHAQPEQSLVYRHGGGVTRVQLPLQQWDYRLLRTRSVERFGLSATIEQQDGRLSLKVKNESGRALTDCWLVAPGMRVALGDLASGESWAREFPLGGDGGAQNSGRDPDQVSLRDMTFKEKPHEILFPAFFPQDAADAPWRRRAALFFGWVKDPGPRLDVGDPRIRPQSYALYRAIVPLAAEEE